MDTCRVTDVKARTGGRWTGGFLSLTVVVRQYVLVRERRGSWQRQNLKTREGDCRVDGSGVPARVGKGASLRDRLLAWALGAAVPEGAEYRTEMIGRGYEARNTRV